MIPLSIEGFCNEYENTKKGRTNLILSCYKDLFDDNKPNPFIIKTIKSDTGISVSQNLIYYIKHLKRNVFCFYNPLWRTVAQPLQKGNKIDIPIVPFVPKPITNTSENTQSGRRQINTELPDDYVRVPCDFEQKRYHESLKDYTFDYPWKELDEVGIPRPIRVGSTHNDRLQLLLDLEIYDKIKESYVMPDTLKEFKQNSPHIFDTYTKRGFPRNKGGYHPDEKVFNS